MTTTPEYAQLALYVYNTAELFNRPNVPDRWTRLEYQPDNWAGLSYGVFQRIGTNEIVLAYTGSNQKLGVDYAFTNVPAGVGLPSLQIPNAALIYQQVRQRYGDNITLTGHSLGGGLASVMAVWFNRPAVVFDEAPFQASAVSWEMHSLVRAQLALLGYSDPAMSSALSEFASREGLVTNHYLEGEILQLVRVAANGIYGSSIPVSIGVADMSSVADKIELHSQTILAAALMSPAFRQATFVSTRIVPRLLDSNLYHLDAQYGAQQNLLVNLIRSEQSATAGQGKLTHMAADLQKLGASIAGLNTAAQDALIAQAIEWYYWQGVGYTGQEFFTKTGELFQYSVDTAHNRSFEYVDKLLTPFAMPYGEVFMSSYVSQFEQWNVAAGSSGVTATARDATKKQIFLGSTGSDNFSGGQEKDIMFGGADADTLNGGGGEDKLYGGTGNDTLIGGTGEDTYIINSGDGADTIIDSGRNRIVYNGKLIAGLFLKEEASGKYKFVGDDGWTMEFHSPGVLTLDADTSITFANDTTAAALNAEGYGLRLVDTPTEIVPTLTISGDIQPEDINLTKDGIQAAGDAQGNPIGTAGPYADILSGSDGNDHIVLGELDDDSAGGAGDDWMEGGNGNDFMRGDIGNDLIEGGAGRDILLGEDGNDRLYATAQADIASAIASGNSDTGSGNQGEWLSGNAGDDTLVGSADNDVLSGGAGTDLLIAGAGDDNILGDADYTVQFIEEADPRYNVGGTDWYHSSASTFNWTVTPSATPGGATVFAPVYGETDPIGGGADVIHAGAGNDHVWAGEGDDYVAGEDGSDSIIGEAGNDVLLGGAGDDEINGDASYVPANLHGDDFIDGGEGNDTLWGGKGNDALYGGIGDDKLYGESGADYLDGEDGNDTLNAGGPGSELFGGAGDDNLSAAGGGNYLDGEDGADTLLADAGNNSLFGGAGDDRLDASGGNNYLDGEDGNNTLIANDGNNTLYGGSGNDYLSAGGGNSLLNAGDGTNTLIADAGGNTLIGGTGDDTLYANGGNSTLDAGAGNNSLNAGGGRNTLTAGAGNDYLGAAGGFSTLNAGDGSNTLVADSGNNTLNAGSGNDTLSSTGGNSILNAGDGDNLLIAEGGRNTLISGAGADTLSAAGGLNYLAAGAGNDTLIAEGGSSTLLGEAGDDILIARGGNNTLDGGEGRDWYVFDTGFGVNRIADSGAGGNGGNGVQFNFAFAGSGIVIGLGSLKLTFANGDELHIDNFDPDDPSGTCSIDTFAFADRTLSLQDILNIGMDVVGTPQDDIIVGTGMNERINALAGDDIILAGAGNDTIDAGDGDDSVDAGEGNDLVNGGAGSNTLQGGAGSDSLIGGSGSDWLDGGEGSDFLSGEAGDDSYVVDSVADVIFETAGTDTVHSSVTLTLAPGLENLTLTGTASIDATGNDADNTLTGNDGNNQLDGKVGADTTAGGAGDDIYLIDNAGDIVIEALNAGTDTVQSTLATYTLTDNVENLSLNLDTDQDGSGNALDNIITGNAGVNVLAGGEGSDTLFGLGGNDSLDGGSGADVMDGGVGNDTYIVDNAGDQVIESQAGQTTSGMQWVWTGAGTGWQLWPYSYTVIDAADTVNASISYTLGQNLENLTLTGTDNLDGIGNALNNLINGNDGNNTLLGLDGSDSLNGGAGTDVLVGGAGNDVLNGDAGADLMEGGLGHDTYTVDDSGDQVIETALLETWGGQGWDVVNSSVSYTLSDHVEVLMLTGTDNIDGAGSAQDNTLIGNAGINVLAGGQGNDSYIVQTTGDTVVESADEGIDSVESSVDFTLGENVENLSLIDTAVNGTGNALDNAIIGNLVDNTLSGEGGNDYLDGDNGNDYVSGGAGDDEIRGGNDDGNYWYFYSGNQDTLNGGDGNDTIDGQSGNDAIYGGTGNDALFGGDDGGNEESNAVLTNDDMIDGGDGSDSIDGGTGADRLFGGAGDDTIYGGQASQYAGYYDYATDTTTWGVASDNDYLDGGAGLDVLMGEQGDDIYVVDGSYLVVEAAATLNDCGDPVPAQQLAWTTDTVTEYGGEGYDTVLSSASYALTDNVEELRLVFDAGTGATDPQFFADLTTYGQDGTGNDLDNLIVGNELANRLDGGAGADTLEGGAGNDTYVIDSLDTVVENADSGIDTMVTDFDYSLTDANLENLTLLDGALNGQGNAADNVLQGNAAGNFLEGMEGNDKLIGGQGDDDLLGGAGNDRYVFRLGDGADVIDDWQGNDTLFIGNDLTAADIDAERFGDDLLLTIKGTTDSVAVINWFTQAEGVTWLEFCDGSPLDHAEIEALALRAPPLAAPIADQLTEQDAQFSFGVPADAFVDPNAGDTLSYEASLADGSALPAWLAFDAATQTFSGTPSNWDVGSLNLRVTATDNSGLGASSNFVLNVLNVNDAPTVVTALSAQSVTAGQIFEFVLPRGTISASVLDDPTDTGTPDATWTGYDQYFWGSGGNDTYTFTRGDGKVYIGDWDNSPMDTVQLTDVQAADISITQDQWGALTLSVGGTADNLTLGGWLYSDEPRIEQLVFADGSAWGVSEILSMASTQPTIVSDYITGTDGDDAVTALAGDDGVRGWAGNDLLLGGSGNDALEGGGGSDILSGGTGSDDLSGDWNYVDLTNDLLAGGAGNDYLYASISNDLLIGGTGNDEISGNDGNDVLLFNRGDGNDWVYSDESTNDVALEQRTDTVSVGGGIAYVDLSFSRDWDNLILNVGNGESITFSGWFNTSWRDNKAISTLQVIAESMTDYNPDSADPLLNKRVQQFDFVGLANLFEADLAADPTIVEWLLEPHLNEFLLGASDTSAIGGNLAYLYGKSGNLDGLTEAELRAQLGDASFGKANQILTKTTSAAAGGAFGDVDFIHGDSLSYSASLADGSPLPAWLSFDAATGIFSGTPANRDGGVLSVAVTATDTGGLTASSLFSLDVISLNTAPVAVSDTIAIDEDDGLTSVSVAGLLANDIDPDVGDMLSIVGFDGVSAQGNAVTMDAAGDLVFAIGGSYQSLAEGQTATDSFAYTVADLDGEISTAIVDVVITGANDAPVAATPVTDQLTDEDAFFSFAIPTDSFTDIDHGDALTYTATLADGSELPSWLSFDVATQTFSGMPLNTDVGNFGVLVTATDTGGLSATSEFALEVMNVNDVPIAADDAGNAIEDGGAVLLSSETLLANDTDPDSIHGDVLSIVGVSQAVSGAAVSLVNGTVRYDIGTLFQSLGEGQIAADTFSYTAMDTSGATSTANVHMTVTGTNDAPIVETAIANQTTLEDVPFSFTIPTDSFTDIDTGDTLTYSAKLADGSALPSWLSFDVATQTFSGTPLNGDVGNLDVLVTATDTGGLSVTGAFALDVLNVNDVPIAADDVGNAIEDGGAVLMSAASLLTNDSDPDFIHGDVLSIVGVSQADSGAAVALVNGAVEYDIGTLFQSLGEGQTTVDTFSYTVSDVAGATSTATVTMTVAGVNDGPVTAEDAAAVGEDASLVAVGNVLANDSDVDQGTVLSVAGAVSLQGNYGSLVLNADGSYGYALDNVSAAVQGLMAGQAVADVFAYQATDGLAATPGRLTVTITGSNDAPVAQDDGSAIDEDNLLTIQAGALLANDTDADIEDTAMMAGVDGVSILGASVSLVNGAVVYDQGGRFNSLMAGMTVTDSFGYTMTDGVGAVSSATVSITVSGVNDGPTANSDAAATDEDTALTTLMVANLMANDTDVDAGDVLSFAGFDSVSVLGNAVSVNTAGDLVFDIGNRYQYLAQGETLTDTFSYSIADTAGAISSTRVEMTIAGRNDAPVAAADIAWVQEDLVPTATGNVLNNDGDVDQGTVLSVADAGHRTGSYGSLALAVDGTYAYTTDTASSAVQSLGRTARVVEQFAYTATDGMAGAGATLEVTLAGTNDAPIVVKPLTDVDIRRDKDFCLRIPADSFFDIDQGDALDFTATLSDGSALPCWLKFDAVNLTLHGEAPKELGFVDVRIVATDRVAATGSREGSLSTADVMRLNIVKKLSGEDDDCGDDHHGHGNEGVGNGEDPPPPGHDYNHNDGPGTGPGYPGNRHGQGRNDHEDEREGDEHHGKVNDKRGKCLDLRSVADHCERFGDKQAEIKESSRDHGRAFAQWLAVDQAIARQASTANHGLPSLSRDKGADLSGLHSIGKDSAIGKRTGVDPISLLAGGQDRQVFKGLSDGMRRFGG